MAIINIYKGCKRLFSSNSRGQNNSEKIVFNTAWVWFSSDYKQCKSTDLAKRKSFSFHFHFFFFCWYLLICENTLMKSLNKKKSKKRKNSCPRWVSNPARWRRRPTLMANLSNHDGNAKENVTLKMTSKNFKLLRDSFNSFNLTNVAEQSGSWLCKDSVTVQVEKRKVTVVRSRSQ